MRIFHIAPLSLKRPFIDSFWLATDVLNEVCNSWITDHTGSRFWARYSTLYQIPWKSSRSTGSKSLSFSSEVYDIKVVFCDVLHHDCYQNPLFEALRASQDTLYLYTLRFDLPSNEYCSPWNKNLRLRSVKKADRKFCRMQSHAIRNIFDQVALLLGSDALATSESVVLTPRICPQDAKHPVKASL
jgi:hypothetical protein